MSSNVEVIQKKICAKCLLPILKGEVYYEVPTPTGVKPIHEKCLAISSTKK